MDNDVIRTLIVTCCDHPDNHWDEIPGAVWADYWGGIDEPSPHGILTISQLVPLDESEPQRFIVGGVAPDGTFGDDDLLRVEVDGRPARERVRESCAGCGTTLTIRDETWARIRKGLETLEGFWHEADSRGAPGEFVDATISLQVLKRLAENGRGRTR